MNSHAEAALSPSPPPTLTAAAGPICRNGRGLRGATGASRSRIRAVASANVVELCMPASDEQHERRLRVGGCLDARADAEELLRLADAETSFRPATRTRPD